MSKSNSAKLKNGNGGAAVKESLESMKFYFYIVGALTATVYGMMLRLGQESGPLAKFPLVGVVIGVGFVLAGLKLKELLSTQPMVVYLLLGASVVFSVAIGVVGTIFGAAANAQTTAITGVAISVYLWLSARNLAAEYRGK